MNAVIAIILGITIGFVGEWLFDFFYLRRKTRRLEENIADLEQQVTATEGQLDIMSAENQRLKRAVLGIAEEEGEPDTEEAPAEEAGGEMPVEPAEEDVWLPDFVAEVEQEISQETADSEMEQFEEAPLEEVEVDYVDEGLMDEEMPEVPPADEPLITEPPIPAEEPIQAEPAMEPAQDIQEEPVPPEPPEEPPEAPVDMEGEPDAGDQTGEPGI